MYDDTAPNPVAQFVDEFDPIDDMTLVPQDGMERLGNADINVQLDLKMDNLGDGAN